MTMITPSYLGETIEYSSLHACRSTLEDPTRPTKPEVGKSAVHTPDDSQLRDLSVHRLRLQASDGGPWIERTEANEVVLDILCGSCRVEASTPLGTQVFESVGQRRDVFSGSPTFLVFGPGSTFSIEATSDAVDLAMASVPVSATPPVAATIIRPDDVRVHTIGEGHYLRTVREVLGGETASARIRAGETINPIGSWSSWPHHEFAADSARAPLFEEIFLYFTKPGTGWALQRRDGLLCTGEVLDDVLVVRNGDSAIMPLGDHPVVAGVDSQLLYVWFYISPIPKRYAKWAEDIGGYA